MVIEQAIAIAGEWCALSWAWWRLGNLERTVLAMLCGPKSVHRITGSDREDEDVFHRYWECIAEAWTDVAAHASDGGLRDLEQIALSRAVYARSHAGLEVQ
jgi:hypothetical protein